MATATPKTVYQKLSAARVKLLDMNLKKSGRNDYAGYAYWELGDFLPASLRIFDELGLCGVESFTAEVATLSIHDADSEATITITSPMGSASLKGCHEVQNIGAVETYQRRYLWTSAMGVVEHDALDAQAGNKAPEEQPKAIPPAKVKKIESMLQDSGADRAAFLKHFQIESVEDMLTTVYDKAFKMLETKLKQQSQTSQQEGDK